jgi:pimeloyl-ACP methyl ester carboxylesterase
VLFLMPGLGEWLYTRLRKDSDAAYRSLEPYYSNLVGMPEKEREFLYCRVNERVWDDDQRRAFFSTFRHLPGWLARQQSTLPSRLAASHVPTLIIWGEADRINAVDGGRALAEMHSNARLVLVPGAGHNVQEENAHAVVEAILP